MQIGDTAFAQKTITIEDILSFSTIVGDSNPIHIDKDYALHTQFKEPIAQGMLIGSLISGVLGTKLPGPGCIYLNQVLSFLRPVKVNDVIKAVVRITKLASSKKGTFVTLETQCLNQDGKLVVTGEALMLLPLT